MPVFVPHSFLGDPAVQAALLIGTCVAVASGAVGVFVVLRGQSFAGHALGDIGTTGAAAAYLTGVPVLYGFVGVGILGGLAIERLGERARERDIATGIVLSFLLGVGSLLLYFMTQRISATGGQKYASSPTVGAVPARTRQTPTGSDGLRFRR